tara:strand:- start:66 stop:185 length:120 start_codon:yes stop_codon:yes gene_type:complete
MIEYMANMEIAGTDFLNGSFTFRCMKIAPIIISDIIADP